ncbi:acyl carrier protein [Tumebacillus sp. DT12]|uniref:Acyl carrier protein n=1 Tax=Tumebacillus lacus TaxID=2995335 RepID=A0ABT3WYI1_9BACL|nr:acyl carrier protein [Tumebacillus lacus]MCX7569733.1 acyl carrier protein [Tumebacillus lacus]
MQEQQLKAELKTIIAEIIEVDEFGDDENFVRDLGVDSMMALEIVARIEKNYRIRIPEEFLPEIKTLTDVTRVVTNVMQPING